MPYTVIDNAEGCSGYAVVKEGETVPVPGGCHALKSDAIVHMVALQSEYMEEEIEEEEDEEEERQAPNLVAPAFMKASARRGLALHAEGESGDGLKPQTVADARKMSEGTALSEDKWRRIAPWIARHIGDLDAVQGDEITAGLVAMLLWGGGSSKSSARRAQAYAERIVAQLDNEQRAPAPPKDQIKGSEKNEPGSAEGKQGGIEISEEVETGLRNKLDEHNEKQADAPAWKRTTMGALKAVYRRGAGAFSTSHRPGMTRNQWAMARVNAFLYLCRVGRPENENYITDNDLLHKEHPKYSGKRYDPNQPRDEDGKFGEGGGGGGKEDEDGGSNTDDLVEAELKIEDHQQTYLDRMSETKVEAIDTYTAGGHAEINKILRGGPPPPPELDDEERELVEVRTERIISAIERAPGIPEEITVYRGANLKSLGVKGDEWESLVGKELYDEGIISTSFDRQQAADFASGNEVLLQIRVPAGTKGLALGQISNFPQEREFLLSPGGFRVVSVGDIDAVTPTVVLERIQKRGESLAA